MPQLDFTTFSTQIFWLVVTFGALFLVMWRIAVPGISDALEARQKRMDDHLSKAAEFKKEAEAAIAAYEESLTEARADAHSAIAKANATLLEETSVRDAELAARVKALLEESEANITEAIDKAMGNVREIAEDVASAASERLLGEQVDTIAVTSAVGDAMKDRNQGGA